MRRRPTTTSTCLRVGRRRPRACRRVPLPGRPCRPWPTNSTTAMRTASRSNWRPRLSARSKAPISWRRQTGDIIWCPADAAEQRFASAGPAAFDSPGMAARLGAGVYRRAVPDLPAETAGHRPGLGFAVAQSIRRCRQSVLARRVRVHEERRGRVCTVRPRGASRDAGSHPSRGRADLQGAGGFREVHRRRDLGR